MEAIPVNATRNTKTLHQFFVEQGAKVISENITELCFIGKGGMEVVHRIIINHNTARVNTIRTVAGQNALHTDLLRLHEVSEVVVYDLKQMQYQMQKAA